MLIRLRFVAALLLILRCTEQEAFHMITSQCRIVIATDALPLFDGVIVQFLHGPPIAGILQIGVVVLFKDKFTFKDFHFGD